LASLFVLGGDDGLRRRFSSIEEFIAYNRALRTAELPAHIDPDVWRDWLHVSRMTNRMAQLLAYLVVLFVVLPSLIRQPWYHAVAVSLLGLLATVSLVLSWRKRARITLLAAEVERLAAARAAQSGGDPTRAQMTQENAALSWLRLPLAVRFCIGAAVGFSLAFGVVVLDRLLNGYHDSLVESVAWAACLALVAGVVLDYEGRVRRNFGSFEQFIAYNRASRAGSCRSESSPMCGGAGSVAAAG
jgi:hypothetical protein